MLASVHDVVIVGAGTAGWPTVMIAERAAELMRSA